VNRTRPRPLFRKLALAAGALLVSLLLLEGAMRARQYLRWGSAGAIHEFALDPASGLEIPVPGRTTATLRIDSRGFRNPELEVPKPAGRVRLAFLGASTTFCAEASSNEATWPHRVWMRLQEEFPARSLDYVNAGVSGYTLENIRQNLHYRVAPLSPDVIFIYEATNEITKDTRALAQAQGVYTGHADDTSWLAEHSLAWYLVEKNLLLKRRQEAARGSTGRVSFQADELARGFHDRLTTLVRECQALAPVVALGTFAHKVRREQSPEQQLEASNTSLYYMPYMTPASLLDAFEAYNRAIREVARETGALLIESEGAVPGDSVHFNDSVHFKDAGCVLMARCVGDALLAAEPVRALLH
jgi:lysophospholipase L1-like esterase